MILLESTTTKRCDMNLFLKIWEKIKEPKTLYVVLFYLLFFLVLTGTLLLVIFVEEQTIFHYILYVISATLLAYFVYTMFYYVPKIKQSIINSMNKHDFSRKLLSLCYENPLKFRHLAHFLAMLPQLLPVFCS